MQTPRSDLYHALAEILAEPPEWLARPGKEWPLFATLLQLEHSSKAARHALEPLAEITSESLKMRQVRYANLFENPSRPGFSLYESMHHSGRLLGPETIAIERLYHSTGVENASAELPDHASVELAFLAHIAERQFLEPELTMLWIKLEQRFIKQHVGCWLPNLGHALARSGDEVYAPIGKLIADWLEEVVRPSHRDRVSRPGHPVIQKPDDCTLCGFCVQACPTHALVIRETADDTYLLLSSPACLGCGKCERICEFEALQVTESPGTASGFEIHPKFNDWCVLHQSPRITCLLCGKPTVSRAEFEFVAGKIGSQEWLEYCIECR